MQKMRSIKPENPFFTGIVIPDEYFCDRKMETETMISRIRNGNNIVLKSPRRIGKSSLVKHVLSQPEISGKYNTLYVDIYGTKCAADFIKEFQNGFLNASFARQARGRKSVETLIKSIYFEVKATPAGEFSGARVGFSQDGGINFSLQEMFNYLERTQKPNIVVFDEFQQIQYYPERMPAILRSFVQQMNNTRFVFPAAPGIFFPRCSILRTSHSSRAPGQWIWTSSRWTRIGSSANRCSECMIRRLRTLPLIWSIFFSAATPTICSRL